MQQNIAVIALAAHCENVAKGFLKSADQFIDGCAAQMQVKLFADKDASIVEPRDMHENFMRAFIIEDHPRIPGVGCPAINAKSDALLGEQTVRPIKICQFLLRPVASAELTARLGRLW